MREEYLDIAENLLKREIPRMAIPGYEPDPATEPQVTIIKKGAETIEEYRMGGELYMMKVTPSHGVPYYLVKETADGAWIRKDGPSEQLAVPQWVIFRF